MTPETHRILPWLSPHVSQGQRHCSTSGLKQQKIMTSVVRTREPTTRTRVCIIRVLFSSTRRRRRVLFKYSARTRLIHGWYSSTRGTQTNTWHPKTNWGHISNEDCDDIGNGVLVDDAYDGEKAGGLLWDCLVLPEKECHNHSGEWGLSSLY